MEFSSIHPSLSHPLFSIIITLYTLVLLYAPSLFFTIALSPVLNSTGITLLFLLKLGANERLEKESNCLEPRLLDHKDKHCAPLPSLEQRFLDLVDRNQTQAESNSQDDYTFSMESSQVVEKELETRMEMETKEVDTTIKFIKWNLKAPLEIIYEEYEGEEEDDEDDDNNNGNIVSFWDKQVSGLERYPSLSMYYPESETDSSSDDDFSVNEKWETHGKVFFKWEKEDDEREELIEIPVDRYENNCIEYCGAEEDNLIEIDIFPPGN